MSMQAGPGLASLLQQLDEGNSGQRLRALTKLQDQLESALVMPQDMEAVAAAVSGVLRDANLQVSLAAIHTLGSLLTWAGPALGSCCQRFLPPLIERAGDTRHSLREEAAAVLAAVLQVVGLTIALPRMEGIWRHPSARTRAACAHGVAQALAAAPAAGNMDAAAWQGDLLEPLSGLLDDSSSSLREAALECLEEVHRHLGEALVPALQALDDPPRNLPLLQARLQDGGGAILPEPDLQAASSVSAALQQEHVMLLPSQGDAPGATGGAYMVDAPSDRSAESSLSSPCSILDSPTRPSSRPASKAGSLHCGGSLSGDLAGKSDASASTSGRGLIAAAQPARTGSRKGGFRDSGGELPPAAATPVESERDLRHHLEALVPQLDEKLDWTKRIEALLRLEGLILGNGASMDCFPDLIRLLKDPLAVQINDRRSAVSKQGCHVLGLLAAVLGNRAEFLACHFLPMVLKIVAITVQVMADAADLCCHTLLHHCHSPKLLRSLCDVVRTDKNSKIRLCCAKYLLQVLEDWEPLEYDRHIDLMEAATVKAAQDSCSEVRVVGRSMFAAYAATQPTRAHALLKRQIPSLQGMLNQGMLQYVPRQLTQVADLSGVPLPPPARTLPRKSSSTGQLNDSPSQSGALAGHPRPASRPASQASRQQQAAAGQRMASQPVSRGAARSSYARRSLSGNALRVSLQVLQAEEAAEGSEPPRTAGPSRRASRILPPAQGSLVQSNGINAGHATMHQAARGLPPRHGLSAAQSGWAGAAAQAPIETDNEQQAHDWQQLQQQPQQHGSWQSVKGLQEQSALPAAELDGAALVQQPRVGDWEPGEPAGVMEHGFVGRVPSKEQHEEAPVPMRVHSWQAEADDADRRRTAADILANAAAARTDWQAKVAAVGDLQSLLHQHTHLTLADLEAHCDKLMLMLLEHTGDPHHKVAAAAMAALQAWLRQQPAMLEPFLDRLVPALCLRLTDAKEGLRSAAESCLQQVLKQHELEIALPHLLRGLEAMKSAKGRCAVLHLFSVHCGQLVTTAAALPALRQWVGRVATLAGDRAAEVRRAATAALEVVYRAMDGPTLLAHIAAASPTEQMTLRRALLPSIPNLDSQIAQYGRVRSRGSPAVPGQRLSIQARLADVSSTAGHSGSQEAGPGGELHAEELGGGTPELQDENGPAGLVSEQSGCSEGSRAAAPVPEEQQSRRPLSQLSRQPTALSQTEQQPAVIAKNNCSADSRPADAIRQHAGNGTSSAGVSAATSNAAADQNVAVLQALVPGAAESSRAAAAAPAAQTQPAGPATDSHKGPSAAARVEGSPQAAASLHTARLATAGAAQQGTAVKWEAAAAVLGPVAASSGGSALQSANQARPVAALQSQAVTGAAAPATCMAPVSSGLALSPASPAVLVPPRGVQLSLEGAAPGVAAEALETALQRADATVSGELAPKIMEELVAAAQAVPESVLAARAEQVEAILHKQLDSGSLRARHAAMTALHDLAPRLGPALQRSLPRLAGRLLDCLSEPSREVCAAADDAVGALLQQVPAPFALELLRHKLPIPGAAKVGVPEAAVVQAATKHIGRVVSRMSGAEVMPLLQPHLLAALFEAFKHASADVRKATVFCLVDLWLVVGEALMPHLAPLSVSQMKLITIYVDRRQHQLRANATTTAP